VTRSIPGVLLAAGCLAAQSFSHRGFLENAAFLFPQEATGDRAHVVSEVLLRYEAFWKIGGPFKIAGSIDARTDTHREVERRWHLSWQDREQKRPAFAVRRLSAVYTRGRLTAEVGKQIIRWGKADILNPTDRFAPRDYLNPVYTEVLPLTAVRATYGNQSDSVDLVWLPRFTPSRVPLFGHRWVVLPDVPGLAIREGGAVLPGGQQAGARWNHIGRGAEYSLSFFDGYNHLPRIDASLQSPFEAVVLRRYPRIRTWGADAAVPSGPVLLKAEAAWFNAPNRDADDYLLYVVQVERQAAGWFLVGGYAGEWVATRRTTLDFAPDRGLTRAFLGRAGYTIDVNRSLAFEAAIRQNGAGVWTRFEYSQAFGQHWRGTAGFTLIRGEPGDFLGQYRRNSYASLVLRYSF
jgi:hypothetical protein